MRRLRLLLLLAALTPALSGCWLWDQLFGVKAQVQVSITDAPADDVDQVRLTVSSVRLLAADGSDENFDLSPPVVINNLQDLQGGGTTTLLSQKDVTPGDYDGLRIYVEGGNGDSYVQETATGGQLPLYTPGQVPGTSSPVKYVELDQKFTLTKNDLTRLVLDVDLRRGLVAASSGDYYVLRPAMRLVDRADTGTIKGTIADSLVKASSCTNDLSADQGNAVYLYQGSGATPGDIYLDSQARPLDNSNPFTVVPVTQDSGGAYVYTAAWLPAGTYTMAFTCQSLGDDPSTRDSLSFSPNVVVTLDKGTTQTQDFP